MKKKLLSLLLVLCMVLPMVPVGVIPAVAAAAGGVAVTFYDVDGGVLKEVPANYGDLVECPEYVVEGKLLAGWDVNDDGDLDYLPSGIILVQKGYTKAKPVFVSPATVIPEEGEVSTFYGNMPVGQKTVTYFANNWQVGYYANGVFQPFSQHHAIGAETVFDYNSGLWSTGGMYDYSAKNKVLAVRATNYTSIVYNVVCDADVTLSLAPAVTQEGTAYDVEVKREGSDSLAAPLTLDYAVYHNDKLIWPTDAEDTDGDGWYNYVSTCTTCVGDHSHYVNDLFPDLSINGAKAGDVISVRTRMANGDAASKTFMTRFNPQVTLKNVDESTFVAEEESAPSSTLSSNYPYYNNNYKMGNIAHARGNWSFITRHATNWNSMEVIEVLRSFGGSADDPVTGSNWGLYTESQTATDWDGNGKGIVCVKDRGPAPSNWGAAWGSNADKNWNSGVRYIAEYTGSVKIDLTKISAGNTHNYFALFLNGNMIWPVVGGDYTDLEDWFHSAKQKDNTVLNLTADAIATTDYMLLSDVFVEKGDSIELFVKSDDKMWNSNGASVNMTVSYTNWDAVWVAPAERAFSTTDLNTVTAYKVGDSFTFPNYTPAASDHVFKGWDVDGDGVTDYAAGDTITLEKSLVYAPVVYDLSFSRDEIKLGDKNAVIMPNGWRFVGYAASDYTTSYDMDTLIVDDKGNTTGTVSANSFFATEKSVGVGVWTPEGYPLINWLNRTDRDHEPGPSHDPEFCWGQWGAISASNNWNAALVFTATHTGYIDLNIDSLSSTSSNKFIAVFVDGDMVWPKVGGSYINSDDWKRLEARSDAPAATTMDVTTLDPDNLLKDIFVVAGQDVEIMVKSSRGLGNGALIGASVEYGETFPDDQCYVKFPASVGGLQIINKGEDVLLPEYVSDGAMFMGWDLDGDAQVDGLPGEYYTVSGQHLATPVFLAGSYNVFTRNDVSYDDNYKVTLPENWSLLAHNSSNFNSTLVIDTIMCNQNQDKVEGWYLGVDTPNKGDIWIAPTQKGGLWDSYPAINWLSKGDRVGGYWGPWMGACPTSAWNVSYAFTAPYSGYVNVTIDNVIADPGSDKHPMSKDYIAVFVGGIMVWPTAGGSYTNVGDWHYAQDDINDTDLTLLNNLFVESGEKIEIMVKAGEFQAAVYVASTVKYVDTFDANQLYIKLPNPVAQVVPAVAGERVTLPAYTGSGAFLGWDADGDGAVDYTDGQSFTMPNETVRLMPIMAAATTFHTNLPTYNADNSVTYNGGWKAGVYDIGAGKFIPFNYGQSAEVRFSFNNRPWDGSTAAMYSTGRFAMSETVVADGRYNVVVQYTTEMSGNITVDFANLQLQRETNSSDKPGYVAGGFAIYHNGVKIAPVDADYYYYKSANTYAVSNDPVPTDEGNLLAMFRADGELTLDVKKGDTIEVRAFKDDDASRMFIINPTINYNEVTSAPVITATSVTIGETFTMNVFASLNAPRHDYTDEVYLVIDNGYELPVSQIVDNTAEGAFFADVDYVFEIPELPLRYLSMSFDVYMRVYYEDGSYKDSKPVTIGAAEYAKAAIASPETDNELKLAAAALLEYSVASDAYFYGYDSSDMLPDDMPLMPTIVPENVFNLTEFDGDASISGATLTLTETVGLRVYVKTAKNPGRFVLLVDDNEEFSSPRRLQLEKRPSGGYMVDIEVSAAEFSDAFYFCVEDINGDQQSEVLTYSVESYVARQYENEDASEELLALLDAMLVLCKTANDVA